MIGSPVIIEHQDVTDKNADKIRCGVISDAYFNEPDGWYYAEGIIWDDKAISLINDGWSVSCSYNFLAFNDEGGEENNIKYDKEFTELNFTHLAIVNNPRYERANIVLNSKDAITEQFTDIFFEALAEVIVENGLGESVNNDRWITIHPHGEDSDDYRRIKLEDGETPKEAIERVYKKEDKKVEDKANKKNNYKIYRDKEEEYYNKLSKIIMSDFDNIDKYNSEIREIREARQENLTKLKDAVKKEIERLKNIDINKLSLEELKEYSDDIEEIYKESLEISDTMFIFRKRQEISDVKGRLEARDKAKKVGGYTEKLQNLTDFTVFSDISSYSEDLQKHIYDSYKIVYDKYPQIKYGGLRIESLKDSTYANNASYGNIVTLNSKKYDNLEDLKIRYEKDVISKFHPEGTDYNSIIVHELGHGLLSYIQKTYKISGPDIRANVLKRVGIKQKDVKEYLSEYAMAKPREAHEFFAEAFAEYMTSKNPRPLAREFGKEIEKILKS